MVKRRKLSNNPNNDSVPKEEKSELVEEENSSTKTPMDMKSILLSGSKYVYIVATAALVSGIFTPLTLGVEIELVISGILSLLLGLSGGIVIFLGIKNQKFTTIMICGGLGAMFASPILNLELAGRPIF